MEVCIAEIRPMVEDSYTHEQISEFLQQQNYEARGFLARSVIIKVLLCSLPQ